MPTNPIIQHKRTATTIAAHLSAMLGVSVSTAINVTAHSTLAMPFVVTTTTNSGAAGWGVHTLTYSYDGVIHIDSYRSDI